LSLKTKEFGELKLPISLPFQRNFDRLRNRRKLWHLAAADAIVTDMPKSLSEIDDYLTLCNLAANDDKYFEKFRSCSSYRAILENVDGKSGDQICDAFEKYGFQVQSFSHLWHSEIGDPYKYHFPKIGLVSPTELRYTKIILELELLFGKLNSFVISEIGVGFGGQGGQILNTYQVSSYEFIDLPQPLALVKRYLQEINSSERAVFTESGKARSNQRDLVISNYAFSELNSDLQQYYFEKVISRSDRGYVIYNHITPDGYGTMSAKEFADRIPGAEIFAESPLSHPGNVLVAWGHSNKLTQV
jgi:putative sugar O-methyltransferase